MKPKSIDETQLLSRRDFLVLSAASTAAFLTGCATNPVSGRKQLNFLLESGEIQMDQQSSPHQISGDYGPLQDVELNRYVSSVGNQLAVLSHRPDMPYTFRGVNAVYLNAYAFPGGTIAVSRGLLVNMDSEAELAAVLGHEIGHVCARHAAQMYTASVFSSVVIVALTAFVQQQKKEYAGLTAGLGGLAAGAFLARYSRSDEREADELSLQYMTRSGYNPQGCINLMDVLRKAEKEKPNVIEMFFATHPMSDERYETAVREVAEKYQAQKDYPLNRERYQDKTAHLRAMKGALDKMQEGEKAIVENKLDTASTALQSALQEAPHDYTGLLLMAKCQLARRNAPEAEKYAAQARAVYPQEPQALHVLGMVKIQQCRYEEAYDNFNEYERELPGNPNTTYYQGYALEGMGRRNEAAQCYLRYVNVVRQGENYRHAYRRLVEWGYLFFWLFTLSGFELFAGIGGFHFLL
jgi:predicted Zn-dependent protease